MKAKVGPAAAGPSTQGDPEFRVVIADDHRLLLEALKAVLAPVGEFTVVGVTNESERILSLVRELEPHLLVLDYVRQIYAKLDVHSRLEAVRVLLEGAIFGPAG